MKILIASFTFHPEGNGVSEVASIHAFGLARRGHSVTVACPPNPRRNPADYPPNLKVAEFDISGSSNIRYGFKGQISEYQEFVANFECDVIILHGWNYWAADLAFPVLDKNPAKKILVSHGYGSHIWYRAPKFPWGIGVWLGWQPYVWNFPRFAAKLDQLVLLSSRKDLGVFFDRTLLNLLDNKKWSVIPNGASIRTASMPLPNFREELKIPTDSFLLLTVANYCDRKNQLATLRSFAAAGLGNADLVFFGSEINDYGAQLQRALCEFQSQNPKLRVHILSGQPKKMIYAAYHAANVFVLSAKTETQPLAIIDAMACGVPFIALDCGCISEMPGGIVVKNDQQMTDAMRRFATNPELRDKFGREGRKAVDQSYNWERNLDKYEQLLTNLTTARAATHKQIL